MGEPGPVGSVSRSVTPGGYGRHHSLMNAFAVKIRSSAVKTESLVRNLQPLPACCSHPEFVQCVHARTCGKALLLHVCVGQPGQISFLHCCLTEVIFTLLFLSVASFTSSSKNVECLVPYMNLIFQGNNYNFKCLSYFFCSESWQEGNRKENLKVWRSFHPEFVQG